jgi:hypothetical protein
MTDTFPIQLRRPFNVSGQVSPVVPVYGTGAQPFAYPVWPTPGSTGDPALQGSTSIPIYAESAAVIETGTAPMLVTQSGMEAQYRLATGAVTLSVESQSRALAASESVFANAQLVANLYGLPSILLNSFPDMAIVANGQVFDPTGFALAQKNIVFPTLTAPVGTVANTIGIRIILVIIDTATIRDPREPFTFVYSLSGAVAVADPVSGPCANY